MQVRVCELFSRDCMELTHICNYNRNHAQTRAVESVSAGEMCESSNGGATAAEVEEAVDRCEGGQLEGGEHER